VRPQVKAAAVAVFVLLWVVAAVAGLELYLRLQEKVAYEKYAVYAERELAWFGVAADSDQSYWRDDEQWTVYKPNLDVERKVGERIFQFSTDAYGYRTDTVVLPRPAGTFRIVCVGGSTTFEGWNNATTYPMLVEAMLHEKGYTHVEVVNAGVSARASIDLLTYFDDYLRYEPSLVIHYNGVNDLCWEHLRSGRLTLRWRQEVLGHFAVCRRFAQDALKPKDSFMQHRYESYTFDHYSRFVKRCRERGVDVAFATFAIPQQSKMSAAEERMMSQNFAHFWKGAPLTYPTFSRYIDYYNAELLRYTKENGLHCIPVGAQIQAGFDYYADICHMKPAGIEHKARVFAEWLIANADAVGIPAPKPGD
jgi:hypothetical protein